MYTVKITNISPSNCSHKAWSERNTNDIVVIMCGSCAHTTTTTVLSVGYLTECPETTVCLVFSGTGAKIARRIAV